MELENKNIESQASLDNEIKQVPYYPASEDCGDLGAVVPKTQAMEQKNFNNILKANLDVTKFVMNRLGYTDVAEFCQAFAREQVDAIATAIYNFERNGFGLIVSDQTGLGKGRVVAGLIRYTIHHLGKVPVFFTEKPTLFSDIYRDLIDIKFDVGVPIKRLVKVDVDGDSLSEEEIIKLINQDISESDELRVEYSFDEDFDIKSIFDEDNAEILEAIIELYREDITLHGIQDEGSYEKVSASQYRKEVQEAISKGRQLITPFSTTSVKIKDKEGNILYDITPKDIRESIRKQGLNESVKLFMMTYSQIQRTTDARGQITDKFKLIQKLCNDSILILDESHNAAGTSNRGRTMSQLLLSAKDVVYVSATWAKRPDNMPLYALRTSIKESFLSQIQLQNAFLNGGLALQEVVSSALVKTGQLVRRERTFKGETTYYYSDPDSQNPKEREIGLNQINKIDRVANAFYIIADFEQKARELFKKMVKNLPQDDNIKYKYTGGIQRSYFLLFNYFLLGLKIKQATEEAVSQLKSGRKVIVAIANTLESAFSNIKSDYDLNIKYEIGDVINNDFSEILVYMLYNSLQFKVELTNVSDEGQLGVTTKKFKITDFTSAQKNYAEGDEDAEEDAEYYILANQWYNQLLTDLNEADSQLRTPLGISLSPIDQIKAIVKSQGFSIDEITGRSKCLEFEQEENGSISFEKGVLSKRVRVGTDRDIINKFNFNELDALIINQSGSTGVSMHAVPTTDKDGNVILPVNIIPDNPPTSLKNKNEVKQRCMIIMQMELDINREIQKLGRVERSGQVFPPIYKYIFSAIPSEARLSAMMQRKLKSLMANTKGGSEQGKDMFNADDLFSDVAVEPFNNTVTELGLGSLYRCATKDDIYKKTSLFYFMPYQVQKDFFDTLSRNLKNHIEHLIANGLYFGEVAFKDYSAKTKGVIPYIIGNNEASTDFGKHTYAELVEVTDFAEKNTETSIKKYIIDNLSINIDSETNIYNNVGDYVSAMTSAVEEMVASYTLVQQGYISQNQNEIDTYKLDIKNVEERIASMPSVDEAVSIREQIDELEKKKSENVAKITDFISSATDDGLKQAGLLTRENQQIIGSLESLYKQEKELLKDLESVSELKKQYESANRVIRDYNNSIEVAQNRIDRRLNIIAEQEKMKKSFLGYLNLIGGVFDVSYSEESREYDENNYTQYKYVYSEPNIERSVLVGVRFNFNANDHFVPSAMDFRFASVTRTSTVHYNYIEEITDSNEIEIGKKPTISIESLNVSFNGMWDTYAGSVYTGFQTDKVFLSGNLLRGLAFNYIVGASGQIMKYNTADNKLKTSLVLNDDSSRRIMPRFNEDVNYQLLAELTDDNFQRLVINQLADLYRRMGGNSKRKYAAQLLIDSARTFMVCAFNNELKESLRSIQERYSQQTNKYSYELNDDEDYLKLLIDEIRANLDGIIVTITSSSQDVIKIYDNIAYNLPSSNVESIDGVLSESNNAFVTYSNYTINRNGKLQEPKVKGVPFTSIVKSFPQTYNVSRSFEGGYGELNEDIFVIENGLISDMASTRWGKEYFNHAWNISMNYNLFANILQFLEAKYTKVLFTISKQMLDNATPQYTFDISNSEEGTIDIDGSLTIEGVAENTIESIEDVLREFILFYQN